MSKKILSVTLLVISLLMFNDIIIKASDDKCGCSAKPKPRDEERCGCGSGEKPEKCPCGNSKPKPRDEEKCGCGSGQTQTKCPCNKPKPRPQTPPPSDSLRKKTRSNTVIDFDALVSEQIQKFEELLTTLDKALIVRIFLPGCGPCTMTAKPFAEFAQNSDAICLNINANVYTDLARHLKSMDVPMFLFFKKSGVESSRFSGRNNLLKQLADNLVKANLE